MPEAGGPGREDANHLDCSAINSLSGTQSDLNPTALSFPSFFQSGKHLLSFTPVLVWGQQDFGMQNSYLLLQVLVLIRYLIPGPGERSEVSPACHLGRKLLGEVLLKESCWVGAHLQDGVGRMPPVDSGS